MAYTNREKAELKALGGKKHYAMGSIDKMIKKGASKDKALKKILLIAISLVTTHCYGMYKWSKQDGRWSLFATIPIRPTLGEEPSPKKSSSELKLNFMFCSLPVNFMFSILFNMVYLFRLYRWLDIYLIVLIVHTSYH